MTNQCSVGDGFVTTARYDVSGWLGTQLNTAREVLLEIPAFLRALFQTLVLLFGLSCCTIKDILVKLYK